MENSNHIDELITKSFLNELDHEDEMVLDAWLQVSDANRQYYEAMQKAWRLASVQHTVASVKPEEEWAVFRQAVQEQRVPVYRRVGVWLAAASVLLVVSVLFFRERGVKPAEQRTTTEVVYVKDYFKTISKINGTSDHLLYKLPDSTEVLLAPNSELAWKEPFTQRDVELKGMARFKVVKDPSRPFKVTTKQLAVTVLGTIFTMNDFDSARHAVVRLYEGKVSVQDSFYLVPGQEFIYDKQSHTAKVQNFKVVKGTATDTVRINDYYDTPPLPYNERGNWYMFNNQSLAEVFDQLKQIYGVSILYNSADLNKMYFIGKFSKSDSIETILRQIATLNHLTVVKENDSFIISR